MIKLFTDSDCDMPRSILDKCDFGVVPFGVSYGDEKYYQDVTELSYGDFFRTLRKNNAFPKTSQPTYLNYEEAMRPALQEGYDILCLTITSKFSGSFQSGIMAENNLRAEFPERSIVMMDSKRCTVLHGYLMYQAHMMKEAGMSFNDIVAQVEALRDEFYLYMTVDSLEYLRKGGRLGKAGALAGSLLNIKPIVAFYDGELQAHSKVRGRKNAIAEIVRLISKDVGSRFDEYVPIAFASDDEDAKAEITQGLKNNGFTTEPLLWNIGCVVGAHLGPTGFGVLLAKKFAGQNTVL